MAHSLEKKIWGGGSHSSHLEIYKPIDEYLLSFMASNTIKFSKYERCIMPIFSVTETK